MKVHALTQKGTIPVYMKAGRKKPFRLRVSIGGKQHEQYFATRAEAEAEWEKLAPLAAVREQPLSSPIAPEGLTLRDVAEYLHWKARAAFAGLTVADAIRIALEARMNAEPSGEGDDAPPPWIEPEAVAPTLLQMAAELKRLNEHLCGSPHSVRAIRTVKSAARYCGFSDTTAFVKWAYRVGFEIPKTKLTRQQRGAFLVSELDAALLRDPSIYANRRRRTSD